MIYWFNVNISIKWGTLIYYNRSANQSRCEVLRNLGQIRQAFHKRRQDTGRPIFSETWARHRLWGWLPQDLPQWSGPEEHAWRLPLQHHVWSWHLWIQHQKSACHIQLQGKEPPNQEGDQVQGFCFKHHFYNLLNKKCWFFFFCSSTVSEFEKF